MPDGTTTTNSQTGGVVNGNMGAQQPDHEHADMMGKIAELESHDHGAYEVGSTGTVSSTNTQGGGALKKKKKSMKKKSKSKSKKNKSKSKKMKKMKKNKSKSKKMKKRRKRRMKGGDGHTNGSNQTGVNHPMKGGEEEYDSE